MNLCRCELPQFAPLTLTNCRLAASVRLVHILYVALMYFALIDVIVEYRCLTAAASPRPDQ